MHNINVVAELACGHCGNEERLNELVKNATLTGCTALKVQLFKVHERAEEGSYEHDLFQRHFLPSLSYKNALSKCRDSDIEVYADIYGYESLEDAISLKVDGIKIHAEDADNFPLIKAAFSSASKLILSVGGLCLKSIIELRDYVNELKRADPSVDVTFVDGIQLFPTPKEGHSLKNLQNLLKICRGTDISLGVADHIDPDDIYSLIYPITCAGMGARYVEKHLTVNRNAKWTDWQSAFEVDQFKKLVLMLNNINQSLTDKQYRDYVQMSEKYKSMFQKYPSLEPGGDSIILYKKIRGASKTLIGGSYVYKSQEKIHTSLNNSGAAPLRYSCYRNNIGAIITVRSSSSRLPNKALLKIQGKTSIEVVAERAAKITGVDKIIIATSVDSSDDYLASYLANKGFTIFRGSLDNVPLRMYECARHHLLDHIVRITGDCVFLDFEGMSNLLNEHLTLSPDVSILTDGIFGTCKEILSYDSLKFLTKRIKSEKSSEYFEYFMESPNLLKVHKSPVNYKASQNTIKNRLTLDYQEDLVSANYIYSRVSQATQTSCSEIAEFLSNERDPLPNFNLKQKTPISLGLDLEMRFD